MKHVGVIEVLIWGQQVGAVAYDPGRDAHAFEYAPAWKRKHVELAPLTMPTRERGPVFVFPSIDREAFHGLPGLLADALPDRFGNALIDSWMARQGVKPGDVSILDRMAYMGSRAMGALEFRPSRGSHHESAEALDMKALVEQARRALSGDFAGDTEAQAALSQIIRVGTSAGGARAKAVIAYNPATGDMRSGQFDVPPGFEHWLLKFDGMGEDADLGIGDSAEVHLGRSQPYGRIEYAYHLMAVAAGVEMMPCRLLEENGRAHFMTRRFDRVDNERTHVQTLCALQHMSHMQRGTHAYESLFLTADSLGLDAAARTQLFARMAFNVAAGNNDDHTKNFAFMLPRGGVWQLTPAYDVTHARNPAGEWTCQHQMSVAGKFDGITRDDLMRVRDQFSIPGAAQVFDAINAALDQWQDFARHAGLPDADALRVQADHRRL